MYFVLRKKADRTLLLTLLQTKDHERAPGNYKMKSIEWCGMMIFRHSLSKYEIW